MEYNNYSNTSSHSHDSRNLSNNSSDEDFAEFVHFSDVIDSLYFYKNFISNRIEKKKIDYNHLQKEYRDLIPNHPSHLEKCLSLLSENQKFLTKVASTASRNFNANLIQKFDTAQFHENRKSLMPKIANMDKVMSTLRQCVRDWSAEGENERKLCYEPILKEIDHIFPDFNKRSKIRILNPGCGLGRLTWEIARRGFISQGNEFSYFMLFTSQYILNYCQKNNIKIYPYVNQFKNNYKSEDQLRSILIPDVDISDMPKSSNFSMVTGDFLEVYGSESEKGKWDVIASSFFLDTAHNILQYLKVISRILKIGGYLINFGPLLYHYEDFYDEFSIELSLEDIRSCLPYFGFEIIKEKMKLPAKYCFNKRSMQCTNYNGVLWVLKKVREMESNNNFNGNFNDLERFGGLEKAPYYFKKR